MGRENATSLNGLIEQTIRLTAAFESTIIDTMKKYGIKCISFFQNGDCSDFDVTRAYAIKPSDIDTAELKAFEVCCMVNHEDKLYVCTADDITFDAITLCDDYVLYHEFDISSMQDCLRPMDDFMNNHGLLFQLACSLNEIISGSLVNYKPITSNIPL